MTSVDCGRQISLVLQIYGLTFGGKAFVDAQAFAAAGFFDFQPVGVDGVDEVADGFKAVLLRVGALCGELLRYVAQTRPALFVGVGIDCLLYGGDNAGNGQFAAFGGGFGFGGCWLRGVCRRAWCGVFVLGWVGLLAARFAFWCGVGVV